MSLLMIGCICEFRHILPAGKWVQVITPRRLPSGQNCRQGTPCGDSAVWQKRTASAVIPGSRTLPGTISFDEEGGEAEQLIGEAF